MRALLLFGTIVLFGAQLATTPADEGVARLVADTVTVRGTVFDSITRRPIRDANVQLLGADSALSSVHFATTSDSSGAFLVSGVQAGRYVMAFFTPALDTLGLEVKDRVVEIGPGKSFVALATPSPATVIAGLCGVDSAGASVATRTGLLIGHVRDARSESAVENGTVNVTWPAADATTGSLRVVDRQGVAHTRTGGWFALCGVPREVALTVRAGRGADSSGAIEVSIPSTGLRHLTLSLASQASRRGRVVGRVIAEAQRPVVSARVGLTNGDREVLTSDAGTFALDSVPSGTQSLSIRAIGYAQQTVLIQVDDDATVHSEITLERVVALPTVTSTDSAPTAHLAAFLHDKKSDASGAIFVQPIRLEGYEAQQSVCTLIAGTIKLPQCTGNRRPPMGRGQCEGFILNGRATTVDIDDVEPDAIIGVEILTHPGGSRYAEELTKFGIKRCAVVVWTRCPGSNIPICRMPPAKVAKPEHVELQHL